MDGKRLLKWIQTKFSERLTRCRNSNSREIKDTILLDKALLSETVRELKKKQLEENVKLKESYIKKFDEMKRLEEEGAAKTIAFV